MITHIFREGNHCIDRTATLGFHIDGVQWWNSISCSTKDVFIMNRLNLPEYRFY